jgi:hypothetical protein
MDHLLSRSDIGTGSRPAPSMGNHSKTLKSYDLVSRRLSTTVRTVRLMKCVNFVTRQARDFLCHISNERAI